MTDDEIARHASRYHHRVLRLGICACVNIVQESAMINICIDDLDFIAEVNDERYVSGNLEFDTNTSLKDMDLRASCKLVLTNVRPLCSYSVRYSVTLEDLHCIEGDIRLGNTIVPTILLDHRFCYFEIINKEQCILEIVHDKVDYRAAAPFNRQN
jgi:hypothetical protein